MDENLKWSFNMKYIAVQLIVLFLIVQGFASKNEEFRALWVITWEHISGSKTVEENKAKVRQILDNMQTAHMNAVLWQVRQSGTAYYNSSYEPWGYYAGGSDPGYDPLEYAIEEAHKRGMELHAWFNVFQASSTDPGTPAGDHPEWVCRDQEGNPMTESRALSPGLEEVRDYTLQVAMEVVRKYDIDGLHMDYIRWNEYYSTPQSKVLPKAVDPVHEISLLDGQLTEDEVYKIKENQTGRYLYDVDHPYSAGIPDGFDTWEDWWRWSVTEFVKTLHDSIKAEKPWVRLSAAALGKYRWSGWQGYGVVYQDAGLWYNEGYVDQLTPMHYHWTTATGFYDMLNGGHEQSWIYYIQPGVDAGYLYTVGPGSYILADNNVWGNHKQIVEKCREISWVDGFQFFSYGSWANYNYWEEAGQTFFDNNTKIRAAKYLADLEPDSPTLQLNKIDSLNYDILVTPPASPENQWFAIYRSTSESLNPDSNQIADIHFGKDAYTFRDSFTGNQNFNGQYVYYATTLDRYWNESSPSNSETSDIIPSFAPEIIATTPQSGDTVQINTDFYIEFSKLVNKEDFLENIEFSPAATIKSLVWSEFDHAVTIKLETGLMFATDYVLTIKKELTDLNGVNLNGDPGSPGSEDFVLNFRTVDKDLEGPKIVYSNPDVDQYIQNFDVDEVISVAFDELIDANSINSDSIKIQSGKGLFPANMMVNTLNNQSIVTIQGEESFLPYYNYSVYLNKTISDTAGNSITSPVTFELETAPYQYNEKKIIDNMIVGTGVWQDPEYSGSTIGTVPLETTFEYSKDFYLPTYDRPLDKSSGCIKYKWDTSASDYLLRDYLSGGSAQGVTFDTSYTLQCHVFGDGSNNYFRFSLREVSGQDYPLEVSHWIKIDWLGWKIVEWDLGDPESVGTWLGNEIMDGSSYYVDSFQLTHDENGAVSGQVCFKNLRVVKKEYATDIQQVVTISPLEYQLEQNYPNPFNPTTQIKFTIPESGYTTLKVYDILGRHVNTILAEDLTSGRYQYTFNGNDLASGTYFYVLKSNKTILKNKMLLIK